MYLSNVRFEFLFFADVGNEPLKPMPQHRRAILNGQPTIDMLRNRHGNVS